MMLFFEDGRFWDDDADDASNPGCATPVDVPMCWAICERCDGDGQHDHPAFSNGITASEWADDWDEESRETYLRGGYDVPCDDCGGSGKVRVPDLDKCSPQLRAALEDWRRETHLARVESEHDARWGY